MVDVTGGSDPEALLARPYAERQRVVVADDEAVAAERAAEAAAAKRGEGVDWNQVAKMVFKASGFGLSVMALEVIQSAQKARSDGFEVLTVGRTEAEALTLPPGHPRDRVIYVGPPTVRSLYYPAAAFHRFTFEHKFSEAVGLVMALGATELEVEHVRGWSQDFAARLSAPVPTTVAAEAGATAGRSGAMRSAALFRAKLTGSSEPAVPEDLVWLPYEPTWKQVVDGRIKYGLQEFQLSVHYEDDFGIDAGFKLAAQKVGFDLGGSFQEHEATTWKINGTFRS